MLVGGATRETVICPFRLINFVRFVRRRLTAFVRNILAEIGDFGREKPEWTAGDDLDVRFSVGFSWGDLVEYVRLVCRDFNPIIPQLECARVIG